MYSTPRKQLPDIGARPLASSNVVLAFPSLLEATATRTGHHFQSDFDPVIRSLSRYFINLSENKFVSLNEDAIIKSYNGSKVDVTDHVRLKYNLNHLRLKDNMASKSTFYVVQQADEEDPISQYEKDENQSISRYVSNPSNIFVTPLISDTFSFLPPTVKEIYPELNIVQLDLSHTIPNTWTIKRVNNKNLNLNAESRRLKIGLYQGWVDEDGPVSLLDSTVLKKITESFGSDFTLHVLNTKINTENEIEFSKEIIQLNEYKPGMFILVRRNLLVLNILGILEEISIDHLVHFGVSYKDLDLKEHHALNKALDILVKDFSNLDTSLQKHPVLVERYKETRRFFPDQIKTLGKNWYLTLNKLNPKLHLQSKYEDVLLENRLLPKESWDSLNFSKLLVRTEAGRNFKRNLNAAQNKEKALLESESIYTQHKAKRNQILTSRDIHINQLKELKRQLQAKEEEVRNWNNALGTQKKKLDQVKKDFDVLHELAAKSSISQEDILKELGIEKLPNIQQIWLRQNWIVLNVIYKNKVSGLTQSISENKECSLNTNWFLHELVARTIRPNKIRVGARDPEWETKWGTVVGGPYLFKVSIATPGDSPIIQLFPAEKTTILGVHPEHKNLAQDALRIIKLHPHTAAVTINPSDTISVKAIFTNSARVCAGEATTALWQCFQNEDLNLILLTLNSWVSNADPSDHWGREYNFFPKVEEIPALVHNYSFEEKTFNYINSTNDINHLYYQIKYIDGLSNGKIRFGSMVKQKSNWIIPSSGGKTLEIVASAENINTEVERRINNILKKGYKKYEGILVNQTAEIEKVLNEQQENNETNNAGTA